MYVKQPRHAFGHAGEDHANHDERRRQNFGSGEGRGIGGQIGDGDDGDDGQRGHCARAEAEDGGVEQVVGRFVAVAGHVADEQDVQAEVGDDVKNPGGDDGRLEAAGASGAEQAQVKGGKAEVNQLVEQIQGNWGQTVFGEAAGDALLAIGPVKSLPAPNHRAKEQNNPGHEAAQRAQLEARRAIAEAHLPLAGLQHHASEVAIHAGDWYFYFFIVGRGRRPYPCLPPWKIAVVEDEPAGFGNGRFQHGFSVGVSGNCGWLIGTGTGGWRLETGD